MVRPRARVSVASSGKLPLIATRPAMKLKRSAPAGACNCALPEDGSPASGLGADERKVSGVTRLGATCERAANGWRKRAATPNAIVEQRGKTFPVDRLTRK